MMAEKETTAELTEKEKARKTFAALLEIIDILAAEHEKEQEETHHVD
jgi:hypothetical protein